MELELLRKNIRFIRKKHNLTLEQFGKIIDLKKATISSLETGTTGISIEALIKIHDFFGVSLDDLFFKDIEKNC